MTRADNEPKPLNIIRPDVPKLEVGREYLKVEWDRLFRREHFLPGIEVAVDELPEEDLWRMLAAISLPYRLNGMFWIISNTSNRWSEERWSAEQIRLHEMSPSVDRVTFSSTVDRNPVRFGDYLNDYFLKHPSDDPEHLGSFRPSDRSITLPRLFTRVQDRQINLLDGGNRLMAMVLRGQQEVTAYTARVVNPEGKPMAGEAIFMALQGAYRKADTNDQQAILQTILVLARQSSDGREAVESRWVRLVKDPELRTVGQQLIDALDKID